MSSALVLKVGGELFDSAEKRRALITQIGQLRKRPEPLVLVHGGGPQISRLAEKIGITPRFVRGQRVTDAETIRVVSMVLLGEINAPFVAELNAAKIAAVGINGADVGLFQAVAADPELGFVGRVEALNCTIINSLTAQGIMPVVASLGADMHGVLYNINADIAAGQLAGALKARRLVAVTNVKGLYRQFGNEESFIQRASISEIESLLAAGAIASGMIPKLEGLLIALRSGAAEAQIVDGRDPSTILEQIDATPPLGTVIYRSDDR